MVGPSGVRRRAAVFTVFAMAAVGMVTGMDPAAAVGAQDGPPAQVLERDMRGEDAIRALGDRLPRVAAQNDLSPAAFRAALRAESMLWVGRTGQLLFVDEFGHGDPDHAETSGPAAAATVPAGTDVFDLHSRPTAKRTIVLDFNGHDARGTAWGNTSAQDTAPYSIDSDPTTFSPAEQTEIYGVWQRVAEDFAPFDVNVTTKDPGHGPGITGAGIIRRDSLADEEYGTRVVVTPSKPYNCTCGGVAYLRVFNRVGAEHDKYQPAWVFTAGVGTGAKTIAEAASHEAGHNLGLSHDGTDQIGYYRGHGNWAPIMGVGYDRPISQWSRGEYAGANNTEDDFAVMGTYGAPAAPDDIGSTLGTATALDGKFSGVIGSRTDVDLFSFSSTVAGVAIISADPAPTSPNLDIQLRLFNSSGTLLATADPASSASTGTDTSVGLDADLVADVGVGTYYVEVDGVGFGDPSSTGYSDYGSLGRYTISASVTEGTVAQPPPANQPPTASFTSSANGLTVQFTDTSTDVDGSIATWSWDFGDGPDLATIQSSSHTFAAAGTYTVTLTVTDNGDAKATISRAITVKAPKGGGGGKPSRAR